MHRTSLVSVGVAAMAATMAAPPAPPQGRGGVGGPAPARGLPIPPRTTGMDVCSGAAVEGRQPECEIGFDR